MFEKETDVYKVLVTRIKSLEDLLGVAYAPAETENDYSEHLVKDYGWIPKLRRVFKWVCSDQETKFEKYPDLD